MMYNQANTIKNYEKIRRIVRGGPILTFLLLVGISGGLLLADCWGNIPTTQDQLQMQALESNGNMHLCLQQHLNPLGTARKTERDRLKTMTKIGRTPTAQLRHQRLNEKLRKKIQARKTFLKKKRKCKVAGILFLASLSKPSNKP